MDSLPFPYIYLLVHCKKKKIKKNLPHIICTAFFIYHFLRKEYIFVFTFYFIIILFFVLRSAAAKFFYLIA